MANRKNSFFDRLTAMILTIAIVLGSVPVSAFAATGITAENQVADNGTINGWQQYFGTGSNGRINTEYAGAIWTDKSVFTDETLGNAFSDVKKSSTGGSAVIAAPEEDNFLISLSAL